MDQEGSASLGADGAGGRPRSCSSLDVVLRPQVVAGEEGSHDQDKSETRTNVLDVFPAAVLWSSF